VLGFAFKDQPAQDSGVESLVTEIKKGGALWLAAMQGREAAHANDVITHVDGKEVTGDPALFTGKQFSRVCLAGRRGGANGGAETLFECSVVRAALLPARSLEKVETYVNEVACLPPAPPISRVNANSNSHMTAPLIHGHDIKEAALVHLAVTTSPHPPPPPLLPSSPQPFHSPPTTRSPPFPLSHPRLSNRLAGTRRSWSRAT
jgi:hypothetical protein